MIAKEWWEARWGFGLALVVVVLVLAIAPQSYSRIQADIERNISYMKRDLASPVGYMPAGEGLPEGMPSEEEFKQDMREQISRMKEPEYAASVANVQLEGVSMGWISVLGPLALLLGVALVSSEVGRGSILLLLSKPLGRTCVLLTKYAVAVATLTAVVLVGAVGTIATGYAHGYPAEAVDVTAIAVRTSLFWLAGLFVLGMALLASTLFRSMVVSFIVAVVAIFTVLAFPGLLDALVGGVQWLFGIADCVPEAEFYSPCGLPEGLYERLFLLTYWGGGLDGSGFGPGLTNLLVSVATAVIPLFAALWLFRRKAY